MSERITSVPEKVTSIATGKPTRYKPDIYNHKGKDVVMATAEERKLHDAKRVCERFSQKFINALLRLRQDEAVVLELLAHGIRWSQDEDFGRYEKAAQLLDMKRKTSKQP